MQRVASPAACLHQSNLLTYMSLGAGLGAIALSLAGHARGAGALIALAVIADVFDGRFAQRFDRSAALREFGVQIDSLADAVAFAVAPVICVSALAAFAHERPGIAWWCAAFVYVACGLTRLGFYNISHEHTADFIGIPAPVAALIWSTVLLSNPGLQTSAMIFLGTGVAMIAPVRIQRPSGAGLYVFALWPLCVIAAHMLIR